MQLLYLRTVTVRQKIWHGVRRLAVPPAKAAANNSILQIGAKFNF
jgi:hypothetical protein